MEVDAEAHRVLAGGVLSGYDVSLEEPGHKGGALFVDDSSAPAVVGQGWGGTVTTEELPGGGLHRHVCTTSKLTLQPYVHRILFFCRKTAA